MKNLKKYLYFLTPHERKRAVLLLIIILIMAILDTIGVASILPFITILTNPSLIETNNILKNLFQASDIIGVKTEKDFLFTLGILVFVLLVFSLAFKAFTTYVQTRFIHMLDYSIGKRLLEGYLSQPYSWFLNRNSAELGKNIFSEVGVIIGHGISPIINLIAQSMIIIALLALLFLTDPKLTLIIGFSFGLMYGLIYKSTRNFLRRIGKERFLANQSRYAVISEVFGASKEVKISGLEQTYVKRFSNSALIFSKHQASSDVLNQLPRYALEAISFGGMLLVILYLMSKSGNFSTAIPIIALYAFAGYRMIPASQRIYVAISQLRFSSTSIENIYEDLKSSKETKELNKDQNILQINKVISLKQIYYNYPNTTRAALKNINLNIPVKTTVGLVGTTGSGKTTTVDIILGLLEAQRGTLEVDGQVITGNNCRAWQRSIGYVPQYIYLADDTVAANIAFGREPKDIIQKDIERAAKIANLHEFVMKELPKQYQTTIGERGVRLSGGQRQRIGIARALYHSPQVLILDEATNALDNLTEKAVMDAVNNLSKDITIILIAHRLNTVKNCDIIFKLEKGQLINQGTFDEIIKVNDIPELFDKN